MEASAWLLCEWRRCGRGQCQISHLGRAFRRRVTPSLVTLGQRCSHRWNSPRIPSMVPQTSVGDCGSVQVQEDQLVQALEVAKSRVRDSRAIEPQMGEVTQPGQMLQSGIRYVRACQAELPPAFGAWSASFRCASVTGEPSRRKLISPVRLQTARTWASVSPGWFRLSTRRRRSSHSSARHGSTL